MAALPEQQQIYLSGIHADHVGEVWEKVAPLLVKALEHGQGEDTLATIREKLGDRLLQLWVGHSNGDIIYAGISRVVTYHTGKRVAEIVYLAGKDARKWAMDHIETMEKWAIANHCDGINIIGREGWKRVMPGYHPLYLVLSKDLT